MMLHLVGVGNNLHTNSCPKKVGDDVAFGNNLDRIY